jgi:hypothetical protein
MTATLCLTRREVATLLTVEECIPALEEAFTRHARGSDPPPALLGLHTALGGLHVKAAVLGLDRPYLVAKANANFPGNRARSGLPTIQGVIVLCDAEDGRPLALLLPVRITLRNGLLGPFTTRAVAYGGVLCAPGPDGQTGLAMLLRLFNWLRFTAGRRMVRLWRRYSKTSTNLFTCKKN